jgi:hypothetical protein
MGPAYELLRRRALSSVLRQRSLGQHAIGAQHRVLDRRAGDFDRPAVAAQSHRAAVCARYRHRLRAGSTGASTDQTRHEPACCRVGHPRRLCYRAHIVGAADRAGFGTAILRLHRQRSGLCAAPTGDGERSRPSMDQACYRRQSLWLRQVRRRSDESSDGIFDCRAGFTLDQGPSTDFDFLGSDHHAGGSVLSDLRLGSHDREYRSSGTAGAA